LSLQRLNLDRYTYRSLQQYSIICCMYKMKQNDISNNTYMQREAIKNNMNYNEDILLQTLKYKYSI